jgi:iron complex outermembrane receptor protein
MTPGVPKSLTRSGLSVKLSDRWQLSAVASFFDSQAEQSGSYDQARYPGAAFIVGLPPGGAPIIKGPYVFTVPANYPGNPFGVPAAFSYTFHELGDGGASFRTDTYRLAVELAGSVSGWDLTASGNLQYTKTAQTAFLNINPTALQTALDNGYRIGAHPSPDGAALFAPPENTSASSTLNVAAITGRRSLLRLPGGPLSVAVGAEVDDFIADEVAPPTVVEALQGGNNSYAIGSQTDSALFAELHAPVLRLLSLDAAARYDRYNTYGSSLTPKVGFRFTPLEALSLFGTWGTGFRAPSPAEAQKSGSAFVYSSMPDPILCLNPANPSAPGNYPTQCSVLVSGLTQGNPRLRPETSTNMTLGVTLRPLDQWSLSADLYRIVVDHSIIPLDVIGGSGISVPPPPLVRGAPVMLPYVNASGTLVERLTPVGQILYQPIPYVNSTSSRTQGLDVDLLARRAIGAAGQLSAELNYTRVLLYDLDAYGMTYQLAGTHGPSQISGDTGTPRDRARLSLTWDRGPAALTATVNYVGPFDVTDRSVGITNCADAVYFGADPVIPFGQPVSSLFCTVRAFTEVDLYANYRFNRHASLHASILNLLNAQPPLDVVTYGTSANYDPAFHQAGAVGRFYTAGFTLAF